MMNDEFRHDLPPIPTTPEEIRAMEERQALENACGMFNVKSANQTLQDAALRPNPVQLWKSLVYEGETCCMYGDSNVGKSVLGYQMASDIAATRKVLYFDFELSDKQFQLRYSDENGKLHEFPALLYRVEINPETLEVGQDFEDVVIKNIEDIALAIDAKVIVVDNVTWLCNQSEKAEKAGVLMKSLLALKIKYGWTLVVVAHSPKRNMTSCITQNDLAGSKRLINLFDSAFAIGMSAKDPHLRYVKQIKIRSGELEYHAENVLVYCLEKVGAFLQFTFMGYSTEREHLKEQSNDEKVALKDSIIQLQSEGKTYKQISTELGISPATISRILNK